MGISIPEGFKIRKSVAANVVNNEAKLRKEFENFQSKGCKHIKKRNHQKLKPINDMLYSWFKIYEASSFYIKGPLLKEEAINIKQSLSLPELDGFKALKGWLDKWKLSHSIKEMQISCESLGVSETTVDLGWSE